MILLNSLSLTVRLFPVVIHFQTSSQVLRHSAFTYPGAVFDLDAFENEESFIHLSLVYASESSFL